MKKVSWTTRQELINSTLIVIFSALMLGIFVTGVDVVLSKGVALLIK